METLLFPATATKEERQMTWPKITEIADRDFGFDTLKPKTGKIRFSVRILLCNNEGKICVIKSEKNGYLQLPGGGIDDGETITEALRREAQEETGYSINEIVPIGYTLEKREDIQNIYDWDQTIAYVFRASPEKAIGTNYTDYENTEKFKPIWITVDDFLSKNEKPQTKQNSYSGLFAAKRDLEIAKHFKTIRSD